MLFTDANINFVENSTQVRFWEKNPLVWMFEMIMTVNYNASIAESVTFLIFYKRNIQVSN